jgi:hypothetical protein
VFKLDAREWRYVQFTSILLPPVRIADEINSGSLSARQAGLKACALCALRDDNPEKEEANIIEVYFGAKVLAGSTRERM